MWHVGGHQRHEGLSGTVRKLGIIKHTVGQATPSKLMG